MNVGDRVLIEGKTHPWYLETGHLKAYDPHFGAWRVNLAHGGSAYVKESEMRKA